MEPVTLAMTALAILTPLAKDAGKELVKTVGEIGFEKAKDLLSWLKHRFSDDPAASKDLSRFEADPDRFEPGLEATIKEKAEQDPQFATELKKRIDEVGPMITVFQQIKSGRNITGLDAEEIHSGKVGVSQIADEVDGITGVRTKRIG
jgi:hypothetical protein